MRFLVCAAALVLAGCQWIPGTDQHDAERGKSLVAAQLYDPGSAQFRNVSTNHDGDKLSVCGEVNGKNLQGAYVGFTRFVATPDKGVWRMDPGVKATMEDARTATAACQAEVRSAERSGFVELARLKCDESSAMLRDVRAQVEFEAALTAACNAH